MPPGARSYVSHQGLRESPIFYVYFLRRWLRGDTLADVVAECNERTSARLAFLAGDLPLNTQATAASTHAELSGDASLTITGNAP